jgi:peptidoglycan hydrolase-like protein with peptidoglycan-binding domain
MKYYSHVLIISAVLSALILPGSRVEAAQCIFSRTLELGSTGEDVRCLQKYLNENGYIIAKSGVGSPGNETNLYREKTIEAVKKWQQAMGIFPSTGNFGPVSKSKYDAQFAAAKLPAEAAPTLAPTPTPTPAPGQSSSDEKQAKSELLSGITLLQGLEDYIDDAEDEGDDVKDEQKAYDKAQDYLMDAFAQYLEGNYGAIPGLIGKLEDSVVKEGIKMRQRRLSKKPRISLMMLMIRLRILMPIAMIYEQQRTFLVKPEMIMRMPRISTMMMSTMRLSMI